MMVPRASQRLHESWVTTYQPCCATASQSQCIKTQKCCVGKGCWPHPQVRSLSRGGPGGHCRYPEDRVPPHTSFKSRQWLPPPGWGQLWGCHVSPRLRLGAAPRPPRAPAALTPASRPGPAMGPPHVTWAPASTFWLKAAPKLPCVPSTGSIGCKQNKQISPGDPAIMISIEARARVSSKSLRDKGCTARSQDVQQAAH
jgi:hypothetical protein